MQCLIGPGRPTFAGTALPGRSAPGRRGVGPQRATGVGRAGQAEHIIRLGQRNNAQRPAEHAANVLHTRSFALNGRIRPARIRLRDDALAVCHEDPIGV